MGGTGNHSSLIGGGGGACNGSGKVNRDGEGGFFPETGVAWTKAQKRAVGSFETFPNDKRLEIDHYLENEIALTSLAPLSTDTLYFLSSVVLLSLTLSECNNMLIFYHSMGT